MPTPTEWFVFLGTVTVLTLTPGPAMLYVLARSLNGGRREGALSAAGNAIGASIHVLAAAVGLSALLAASPTAVNAVRFLGAAFLVYLGVQAIRSRRGGRAAKHAAPSRLGPYTRSPLAQGAVVQTLNPKMAMFFLALLPHFVRPEHTPAPVVLTALGLIVVVLALVTDLAVALAASRLTERFSERSRWQERQRAASGCLLIGLGTFVAFT